MNSLDDNSRGLSVPRFSPVSSTSTVESRGYTTRSSTKPVASAPPIVRPPSTSSDVVIPGSYSIQLCSCTEGYMCSSTFFFPRQTMDTDDCKTKGI